MSLQSGAVVTQCKDNKMEFIVKVVEYISFSSRSSGREITRCYIEDIGYTVAYTRNPYGTHSLCLIADGKAIRHGNQAVIGFASKLLPKKQYRKVRKFLASKGIGLNWCIE